MTHDFDQSLRQSHEQATAPWWEPVYREAFPDMVGMTSVRDDCRAQRDGVDRVLVMSNGHVLRVDEKVRGKDYPDIALEIWSSFDPSDELGRLKFHEKPSRWERANGEMVYPREVWDLPGRDLKTRPGWLVKDLACDFIAYAFVPTRKCYLLPFRLLRRAWRQNRTLWVSKANADKEGFWWVDAPNKGYVTRSIAVPIETLLLAIGGAMVVAWQDG